MLERTLNLNNLLKKKSFFLFGPRATGKSSLINHQFGPNVPVYNLLKSDLFLRLSSNPSELEKMIASQGYPQEVVIDEVQKVPMLLNEVHNMIESKKIRFLLTGSSARKLRIHHHNLLAGRAWEANLFPLTWYEIPNFDLMRYCHFGGLPPVYLSEYPEEELHAYVNTYLKEEIQAESFVRKIPAFSRFLITSAITSGQILNYATLSSDTGVPASTIREYYQILEDTFIGFMLPAWTKTQKRKAVSTGKFFYFDLGVKNILTGYKNIEPKSDLFGQAFEHFIALELRAYLSYRRTHLPLSYWRSQQGDEVDFIIGDDIAIEVKTTEKVNDKHLKGLKRLAEENICKRYILISHDPYAKNQDQIECMHWENFLSSLWEDQIL